MGARVAVILSGCGFLDGAEIRESVLSLLSLDQLGAKVQCFAPNRDQFHVINHVAKAPAEEQTRNIMQEAARIARGDILPLSDLNARAYDALVIPGGFGVAKNLSTLAFDGASATVCQEFSAAVHAFYDAQKPIGAVCIAPAVLALALKNKGITVTIGEDDSVASVIAASGNHHQNSPTEGVVMDTAHRIASCSAYMRDDSLSRIAEGIDKCMRATLSMTQTTSERKAS